MHRMRERLRETGPRTTEKTHPDTRSARACPSQGTEKKRAPAPVVRGPVPRKAPQPPLHIKVLTDLRFLFLLMSIDIQVFQTFGQSSQAAPILQILLILAILIQTTERWRGTGPRAMDGPQNSVAGPIGPECL